MRTDYALSIIVFILAVVFVIWLINYLRNRNTVVINKTNDFREPIIEQPVYGQQPVFQPAFQQSGQMPTGGVNLGGARVGQGGGGNIR